MNSPQRQNSTTPRTDAAERFFYESGKPPVGFVDSGVSRTLEVELNQALQQLKSHGVEPVLSPGMRPQTAQPVARKPAGSMLRSLAASAAAAPPQPSAAPQVSLLTAQLAGDSLGEPRMYGDGMPLYRRGERTEHVFILLEGQLRVTQQSDGSEDRLLGPGHVFGEQGLFDEGVHSESLTAVGQVRCALVRIAEMQGLLAADISLLPPVLMALVLQYRQAMRISHALSNGLPLARFEVLGDKTLTGPELHRALVDAKARTPGKELSSSQLMCLKLQASEHLSQCLPRAGMSLGSPTDREHTHQGLMLVLGRAQLCIGEHLLQLGQGSVIGVAEGLTGQPFSWECSALQDIDARALPLDKALARLERADPTLRALASHLCALILAQQRNFQG